MDETISPFSRINALLEKGTRFVGKPLGTAFGEVAGGMAENLAPQYTDVARTAGQQAGEGFPRFLAEAALYGAKRLPLKALGLADVALRSSQQPGADLGSTLAHTAAFATAPVVGGAASRMVEPLAQRVGSQFASQGGRYLASEAVRRGAGLAGGVAPFEAASALDAYRQGESYNPLSPENVIGTAASVLPFEAMHVPRVAREYRQLVRQVPVADNPEVWRVHYNVHDEDRQRDFNDKQAAYDYADELRKTARVNPQVELAGTVPRQYVTHEMAFKPEDLVSEPFGLSTSEVLRGMPQVQMPGNQLAGTIKNKVPPLEWKTLNEKGLGEFLKQPRMPEEVQEWITQNKPVQVETKVFGSGQGILPEQRQLSELEHQIDTEFPGWNTGGTEERGNFRNVLPKEKLARYDELLGNYRKLHKIVGEKLIGRETELDPDQWRSVSSSGTSPQKMVVVRVPFERGLSQYDRTIAKRPLGSKGTDVLHKGSHLGSEDVNVLGWARGHDDVVGGKKVWSVDEVQSDWGQSRREAETLKVEKKQDGWYVSDPTTRTRPAGPFSTEAEANKILRDNLNLRVKEHPLLKDWQRLTLKSLISQAIKEGKDAIVLPDAETAMMSEGHDLHPLTIVDPTPFNKQRAREIYKLKNEPGFQASAQSLEKLINGGSLEFEAGGQWAKQMGFQTRLAPSQEPGMRLNYDRILPKIMEELTGVKGEKVDLGPHQRAFETGYNERPGETDKQRAERIPYPRSNLIFPDPQDPTGFRTHAKGLLYDLSKIKPELAKRGGFPLFGSEKFVKSHVEAMMREGYEPEEIVRAVGNVQMLQPLKGETPLQTLARSVGIEPKLFATMPPGEALPKALDFLTSMFHYNYGLPPDQAAYYARQVGLPLARFAPWLKNTQFAIAGEGERGSRIVGMKEPDSEVFKYLTSVFNFPKTKGTSLESQAFEVARALGHEATHRMIYEAMNPVSSVNPMQRRAVIRALANVEAIPPDMRAPIMEQFIRMVVPEKRWPEVSKVNLTRYKDSPDEFLADFASIISVGSTKSESLSKLQDAMFFGDRASQEFSKAIYRDLTAIWSGTRSWIKDFARPDVSSHETKMVARLVDGIYDNLTKLMKTTEEAERTLDTFHVFMERMQSTPLDPPPVVDYKQTQRMMAKLDDLNRMTHQSYVTAAQDVVDEAVSQIRPYEAPPKVAGERLSFWRDYFKPMSQLVESLKEKVQSAIPVKALAFQYRSMVSESQNLTWKIWSKENGDIDWKRLRWLKKDGTPQERSYSKIALMENIRQDQGDEPLTREEKEKLYPEYKALSPEDKEKVDLSLEQSWGMTRYLARLQWNAHRERISAEVSKIIMSYNKELYQKEAKEMADQAVHWIFDTPKDVEQFQDWFNQREAFFGGLPVPDKGKQAVEEAVRANLEPWQKLGDRLLGKEDPFTGERPGRRYMPEVRVRDWHVAWRIKGEDLPHHEAFKTEKLAANKIAEVRGNEDLEWVKSFNRKDRTDRFRGAVQEEITSAQQDALDALKASVLSRISSEHPEAQEIIHQINEEFQPATAFQQVTVSPYMRDREFIPGRENLNMAEGLVRYVDAVSYQMAKRHVKQTGQVVLFNPDMRENPNIRNNFEKYLRFVTDAEGKEFTNLKNLVFFHYLGFNPVQILIEPTQQLISLVPYLVENGMPVGKAYRSIIQANMDIGKARGNEGTLPNEVEDRALKRAVLKRTVDTGFVSDLYGETDLDFALTRSSIMGNEKLQDAYDLVRRPAYQLLAAARHLYGKTTPALNGKTAFLAAFRHEYERSGNAEKAEAFATQATDATMFGGGRAARPMVLQRFGSMSGVGGLMYTLGSYTFNTIAMMGRLGRKAIFDSKLQPNEKVAAQKAFTIMLGTQFALGGVLGLPFVAAGMALLEQAVPGLDLRKNLRKFFVDLAKDDEDMGHMIADGAMRGVGNALTPVDFGSRFQLANMLGVSPYDGFSWANVAGPANNMLGNYVKGGVQAAQAGLGYLQGEPRTQTQFGEAARVAAPSSIKQIMQMVHDDWAVRDKAGRLITEMTPPEKVLAALGFKPKRLTNYYEEQSIRERTEANQARVIRDIRSDAATQLKDGDVLGARKTILEGTKEAGPYDPVDMAKEAAQLAVEMQSSVARRQGTRALSQAEAEISRLYPQSVSISEVQRVMQQAQLVQKMGMQFGRPNIEQLRTATIVDTLMKQNPKMTLMEARVKAEQMTSPMARRRSAISSLLQAQP